MENSNLIARQPILNKLEEIVAYELLFRCPRSLSSALVTDATKASASVIVNTLSNFGVSDILGGQRGFINVDSDLVMSESIELLPVEQIGLELLEGVEVTPQLIERCRELKAMGCQLALDDHDYSEAYEPLYDGLVDIIKLDMIKTPLDQLYKDVERLKRFPVKLLAEKVDSRAVYLRCRGMGFELFQGYFFARPSLIQKRRLEDSVNTMFELMNKLNCDAGLDDIEESFKKSPALTYKLLLLVNSVSIGLREKIRTVRHAITIIGMSNLKKWVQLAIFAAEDSRGLANPVLDMAAVRAALMENLALIHQELNLYRCAPEQAFMVGILSVLLDFYDMCMDEVENKLNISEPIRNALCNREGKLGQLLELTELLEQGAVDEAEARFSEFGLTLADVQECQMRAYKWRNGLV